MSGAVCGWACSRGFHAICRLYPPLSTRRHGRECTGQAAASWRKACFHCRTGLMHFSSQNGDLCPAFCMHGVDSFGDAQVYMSTSIAVVACKHTTPTTQTTMWQNYAWHSLDALVGSTLVMLLCCQHMIVPNVLSVPHLCRKPFHTPPSPHPPPAAATKLQRALQLLPRHQLL